jgi:NAD(P)-dependent dehydrogenase (short-subunit alcohol dehydrogenase family)
MNPDDPNQRNRGLTRRDLLAVAAAGLASQTLTGSPARGATSNAGTVLITGSNRGIGLELARAYAKSGWRVHATARRPDAADDLKAIAADYPGLTIEQLDLLDHDMIDGLAEKLSGQPIDVLLNNAAILGEPNEQKFGQQNFDLLQRIMQTNVTGPMKMAEAFIDHVERSEQKKIVAITSAQGSISQLRSSGIVFYNMSKAALNMAMRSDAMALKSRGVTVALISPGAVDTAMMNLALERAGVSFPLLTPEQSAAMVIETIDNYGLDRTGEFVSHKGEEIPW